LKFVVAASEKMAPELFERFHKVFGIELMDSIGSSEVTYEWIANRQKELPPWQPWQADIRRRDQTHR